MHMAHTCILFLVLLCAVNSAKSMELSKPVEAEEVGPILPEFNIASLFEPATLEKSISALENELKILKDTKEASVCKEVDLEKKIQVVLAYLKKVRTWQQQQNEDEVGFLGVPDYDALLLILDEDSKIMKLCFEDEIRRLYPKKKQERLRSGSNIERGPAFRRVKGSGSMIEGSARSSASEAPRSEAGSSSSEGLLGTFMRAITPQREEQSLDPKNEVTSTLPSKDREVVPTRKRGGSMIEPKTTPP